MTRADYRAMLHALGPIGTEYLWHNDYARLPYWALAELHDYLAGMAMIDEINDYITSGD